MTTTGTTTRFRGTCNSAALRTYGARCAKVVRFWSGAAKTAQSGRIYSNTKCCDCGAIVNGAPVKVTKSDKTCDTKCYNASSAGCACSCEGDNHGILA
jgi:hypothetical protein